MSLTSVDLPRTRDPRDAGQQPTGRSTFDRLEIVPRRAAGSPEQAFAIRLGPFLAGIAIFRLPAKKAPVKGVGTRHDVGRRRAFSAITAPPCSPAPGAHVDHMVGRAGMASSSRSTTITVLPMSAQAREGLEQAVVVTLGYRPMEARRARTSPR